MSLISLRHFKLYRAAFDIPSLNSFLRVRLHLDNNNRVKLLSEPGMAGSDYINASFVSVSYHF